MPIDVWWVSKGRRCVSCRSRRTRHRPRPATKPRGSGPGTVTGLPRVGSRRREVFDRIRAAGSRGVTFDELCDTLGRSYSATGPRVRELVAAGLVERSGTRRPGKAGVLQEVWRVTTATVEAGL